MIWHRTAGLGEQPGWGRRVRERATGRGTWRRPRLANRGGGGAPTRPVNSEASGVTYLSNLGGPRKPEANPPG
eukprot:753700-Alexandrium_andersonii.AAC.1